MNSKELLSLYKSQANLQVLAESVKPNESKVIHLKGLVGSLDAIVAAATYQANHQNHIFILHEKEEAAYFYNDLQNLLGDKEVLLFPSSYKRAYEFEETENANILMRAEILNRINNKSSAGELIVTYPEALTEKVINKKSLVKNTFTAKIGEQVDSDFLTELLLNYGFVQDDFVYEPGQFAVRGGIVDIYSYAGELPFRIELFGDEIESIRTFDPESQLSKDKLKTINIIPNIQTKLLEETRQSFLDYVPNNSKIWVKDYQNTLDVLGRSFAKAKESFDVILEASGGASLAMDPEALFETSESFEKAIAEYVKIEFGNRFYLDNNESYAFDTSPQPSFNKNFDLIAESLESFREKQYVALISSESEKPIAQLTSIFEEINPFIKFDPLILGLREGFVDNQAQLACFTDHQLFERFHRYKVRQKHSKSKALTLKELRTLNPGDYVVHIDHGIGRFAGLDMVDVNGNKQEAVRLVYRDDDLLYISIHSLHKISKYSGKETGPPQMSKLGSPEWENKKKKVSRKVKDIAKELIALYAKRKAAPGYSFGEDGYLQAELETSFIYEDTPDQAKASEDVKVDMQKPHPMDRLVCGDVGFGKTEVAIRAAFKAAVHGKQAAVLVPTTILAMQHYHTFHERLANFPVTVEYINRFRTTKEIKDILARVKEGKVDILIGTHRIVNKDVSFKDLGILIIDEEQKFGVKIKDKLKEIKVNVDTLTLTATPIPRTLHFSLMGARDLSIIATPPPNRQPVTTEIHAFSETMTRDAVSYELRRGGQVFFVHNRVSDIESVANIIHRLVPDARVGVAHGQMDGPKLEKTMLKFIEGEYDVLVSTNIIESGLDIPNANTIIINNAQNFGLSDLHQMRGRVGRSNKKAFCYLITPPTSHLSADSRKRLSALEEFSDLGDGFKVAMRDLDIRGAGNLLGGEQSGFITDIGFDMYHKILDEAVNDLKENEFKDLFEDQTLDTKALVSDCIIETDLEILIPEDYVKNITERLSIYTQIDNIKTEAELNIFQQSILDRFGKIPVSIIDLFKTVKLRWLSIELGFEKLVLKGGRMRCYFPPKDNDAYYQSAAFGNVIKYVQQHPKAYQLKEIKEKLMLVMANIDSMDHAVEQLENIKSSF
ncbi:transcription-repair coupling factor [Reichenbachiella carrageenanivorans]|uniref:Transcription-repair-coupling factor n=1 Tax=Reichenbachiella carrageenanivorans TaxID=2979869 RepID=A0ABY6D2T1_9BACT|nr:transcription-repair coupling factor [Reichenbachiella carrageenanivorans]UXX80470.1 transcription-repair coupling factor [Reichenbachiella carrageenanivorans]